MAKQVFRRRDAAGRFVGDHVTRADESAEGEPLLVPIVRARTFGETLARRSSASASVAGSSSPPCRSRLSRVSTARPDYPITYSEPSRPMLDA